MAILQSIASGLWSSGSIWGGGVAPAAGDDITISTGHSVTLDTAFTSEKSLTINGKLTAAATLQTGNGTGKECTLTLNAGAELAINSGVTWKLGAGANTLKGTASSWCKLTGAGATVAVNDGYKTRYDCAYFSCQLTGAVYFPSGQSGGAIAPAFLFSHCVFDGYASLTIGGAGYSSSAADYLIDSCDFRGAGAVVFGGTGNPAIGKRIVNKCTFYSQTARSLFRFSATGPWTVDGTVQINHGLSLAYTSSVPSITTGGFFSNNVTSSPSLYYPSVLTSELRNVYLHNADVSPANVYPALAQGATIENCVINTLGSTPHPLNVVNGSYPVQKYTGNLMIGSGDLVQFGTTFTSDSQVSNNTVVDLSGGAACGLLFLGYANQTTVSTGNILRNNLYYAKNATAASIVRTVDSLRLLTVDSDHNCIHNTTSFYAVRVTNNNAGTHDFKADPQFKDKERQFVDWVRFVAGNSSATYLDGYAIMLAQNGYDASSKTQKAANIPTVTWEDLLAWTREGFTPTNAALATAGEHGTYIGAIPQAVEPVPVYAMTLTALPSLVNVGADSVITAMVTADGLPSAGKLVTFTLTPGTGNGSLSAASAVTDSNGRAQVTCTGTQVGSMTVEAVLAAQAGITTFVSLTARVPAPSDDGLEFHPLAWEGTSGRGLRFRALTWEEI